jgi:peptidase M23-like protein
MVNSEGMMSPRIAIAPLLLGFVAGSSTAQVPERQARVDVQVPKNPTAVVTDGKRVLVYELHVTNFDARPLVLRQVDVYDRGRSTPLFTLRDTALRQSLSAAGGSHDAMSAGSTQIAMGARGIVFMWIALPLDAKPPRLLRHRLLFGIVDSAGRPGPDVLTRESSIDSIEVPVLTDAIPRLTPPFPTGDWLAGDGPTNESDHRRSLVPLDGKVRVSQRFAIDWVMIGANGNTWHDDRSRKENYWGFGQPVRAVADGEVTEAVDSIADNEPQAPLPASTIANAAGNHVIVRIAPGEFVMFAHLERGSVRVRSGQRVVRGQVLGALGNSGQSTGPHLHLQVMDASSPFGAEGIPFVFDHFTFMGFGRDYEPDKHPTVPRRHEMPAGDAVVRFP